MCVNVPYLPYVCMFAHLVIVAGLEDHVQDCLLELVLDQEVGVKESLEHLRGGGGERK